MCSDLLLVNLKEPVIAEINETTTQSSAKLHWVVVLTNALIVQK